MKSCLGDQAGPRPGREDGPHDPERQALREENARIRRQLAHADRLTTLGVLVAGVAHELNEPLSSILGFAQIARKTPNLPGQTAQDLDKIIAASLHAREIIRKLLLFARQAPVMKSDVCLNAVVEEALGLFEHRLRKSAIRLTVSLRKGLPAITADAGQLNQVVVNLVVNAIQAMPNGGALSVATFVETGHVVCAVQDTGDGMSEAVLEHIFVPFFTTKEISQGTGLGLPVAQGILAEHGGMLEVSSLPGQGTRFAIRLPFDAAATPGRHDHD